MALTRLPVEVFIIVRDALVDISDFNHDKWTPSSDLDDYLRKECGWSWRNFLVASGSLLWKNIRRTAMIWNLNRDYSRKYLVNNEFKNYLHSLMYQPDQQLQLRLHQIESKDIIRKDTIVPLYTASEISGIGFLHTLVLSQCPELVSLGDFQSLKILKISDCHQLRSVGRMPNLAELNLEVESTHLLPLFPLESLVKLKIKFLYPLDAADRSFAHFLEQDVKRLAHLQVLRLLPREGYAIPVDLFTIPTLKELDIYVYGNSMDLRGFPQLKSLSICVSQFQTFSIQGKEQIYPNLDSLHYIGPEDGFMEENISEFQKLRSFHYCISERLRERVVRYVCNLPRLQDISFSTNFDLENSFALFSCPMKLNSLELSMPTRFIHFLDSVPGFETKDKHLFRLSLNCFVDDISSFVSHFQNISQVHLLNCSVLKNIDCLKNVAYLSLIDCSKITSFACFRESTHLRYLEIIHNYHLTDEDIAGFGNIYFLKVFLCKRITKIQGLKKARFVSLRRLINVKEMIFSGVDYVQISLSECSQLTRVEVTGMVDRMVVSDCPVPQETLQNYNSLTYDD
jgi:hypothetical protein